ncbi:S9 family peptidase [Ktedonobacter racemifer]|uniref:Peptidase S9 prolyl oligopeptidase active site domain protein n=1 Tax=Ktedonobacter racemifer DSM 44963 TaxID=485913 RepID=D6TQG1_KTERA|nr:prolyl oligopeptidase family serine peptidase [Ktedonobacter racemifer]EFH87628.1 peptidase S9 prolyl oligopeptidase active site domain protein [Ktedonobacter racemifer DSM 44963]
MTKPQIAPYGAWASPITTDMIVAKAVRRGQVQIQGQDTYWLEVRPEEGGRGVIVRQGADGVTQDITPAPFNARTRVHEYGGGDYIVHENTVYFANFSDQRLYRQPLGGEPEPLTEPGNKRYADLIIDGQRQRLLCVCEDHTNTQREAVNTLVSIALDGSGSVHTLVAGNDFYSTPRLSPDKTRLCWLTWNHPNMPWDGTELWVGELDANGFVSYAQYVAGGASESIFQPAWSPDGTLYFVSDRSGWWNLYRLKGESIEAICPMEAEFGRPQWTFSTSTYDFASAERLVCIYGQNGDHLGIIDLKTGALTEIETLYTSLGAPAISSERVVFIAGSPTQRPAIVQYDLANKKLEVLRAAEAVELDERYFALPQPIEFPTTNGQTAYAYYYPPTNPEFQAPEGELPPLIVEIHGGPTSSTSSVLGLGRLFWTSRGFALLDVNYGGSTGYGRAYRERLKGQWGVVDVDDCVNGARYLVERSLADGKRLLIHGGSAGGYTTLCALSFRDTFAAGASHFGVSDLTTFVHDTHKFESRYLFGLVGPYPEAKQLYVERSPMTYIDRLARPIIFFQGLEDKIVPPSQAEVMVEALRAKEIPVAYLPFEGEQHGFRMAENIKRSLEAELYFYARIFGFSLADEVEPVEIENL